MTLIADQKIEAVNRLTGAVQRALPYWEAGHDLLFDGDEIEWIIERMAGYDVEVETEIHNLLRIIIEEKALLDQEQGSIRD